MYIYSILGVCSVCVCVSLLDGKEKRKNTITGEFQLCLQSGEAIVKESKDSENLLSGAITGAFVCSRPHVSCSGGWVHVLIGVYPGMYLNVY